MNRESYTLFFINSSNEWKILKKNYSLEITLLFPYRNRSIINPHSPFYFIKVMTKLPHCLSTFQYFSRERESNTQFLPESCPSLLVWHWQILNYRVSPQVTFSRNRRENAWVCKNVSNKIMWTRLKSKCLRICTMKRIVQLAMITNLFLTKIIRIGNKSNIQR